MLTEALLAAALAYTGGAIINDEPQNIHEGISGCAAYTHPLEVRACVERVHLAWTYGATPSPNGDYLVPNPPAHAVTDQYYGTTPQEVAAESATEPAWTPPSWCERSAQGEIFEHESGLDWDEVVPDDWTDEQVDYCFPDLGPARYDDGSLIGPEGDEQ